MPWRSFRSSASSSLLITVKPQVAPLLLEELTSSTKQAFIRGCTWRSSSSYLDGIACHSRIWPPVLIHTEHNIDLTGQYVWYYFHFLIYISSHILLAFFHNWWRINVFLYVLLFSFPSCELLTLKAFIYIALSYSHHFVKFTLRAACMLSKVILLFWE